MSNCSVKTQFKSLAYQGASANRRYAFSVLRITGFTASSALSDVRCRRRSLSMKNNIRKSHARTYSNRV
jgi:hypothetical protein